MVAELLPGYTILVNLSIGVTLYGDFSGCQQKISIEAKKFSLLRFAFSPGKSRASLLPFLLPFLDRHFVITSSSGEAPFVEIGGIALGGSLIVSKRRFHPGRPMVWLGAKSARVREIGFCQGREAPPPVCGREPRNRLVD